MEYKQLHKLGVRLLKLFQMPDELCPNITTRQSLKGVRYLLYKKYVEVHLQNKNANFLSFYPSYPRFSEYLR